MDGYFLLLINAALYAITFVVYMLKKRMIDFGAICLFTFMLSSIGSAWYYSFDKVPSFYPDITISALLYIYFLFFATGKLIGFLTREYSFVLFMLLLHTLVHL